MRSDIGAFGAAKSAVRMRTFFVVYFIVMSFSCQFHRFLFYLLSSFISSFLLSFTYSYLHFFFPPTFIYSLLLFLYDLYHPSFSFLFLFTSIHQPASFHSNHLCSHSIYLSSPSLLTMQHICIYICICIFRLATLCPPL